MTDGTTSIQLLDITPVETSTVTLTIDTVTEPGNDEYDYTAISEVEIYGR